jgi:hypothetical protein
MDSPQHIAVSTAHIYDTQRGRRRMSHNQIFHPRDRRPIGEGKPVDPRNVMQASAQLLVAARLIHHLDQVRAVRQINSAGRCSSRFDRKVIRIFR